MNHMPRAQPHHFIDRRLAPDQHNQPQQPPTQQVQPHSSSGSHTTVASATNYCDLSAHQPAFEPAISRGQIQRPARQFSTSNMSTSRTVQSDYQHIHRQQLTIHHPPATGLVMGQEHQLGQEQVASVGYEQQQQTGPPGNAAVIYETFESRPTASTPVADTNTDTDHIYGQPHTIYQPQQQQQQQQRQMQQVHQTMTSIRDEQLAGYEGQTYAMLDNRAGYLAQESALVVADQQFGPLQNGLIISGSQEQEQYEQYSYQGPADDYSICQAADGLTGMCQPNAMQQQQPLLEADQYQPTQMAAISQSQVYYEQEQMDVHPTIKQQQMMQRKQMLSVGQASGQLMGAQSQQNLAAGYQQGVYGIMVDGQQQQHVAAMKPIASELAPGQCHEFGRMTQRYQQPQPPGYLNQVQLVREQKPQQQQQQQVHQYNEQLPKQIARHKGHDLVELQAHGSVSSDRLDTICRHLIEHMNRFGICVIDNFLGTIKGELILNEVKQLYSRGQYSRGRLVSNKMSLSSTPASSSGSPSSSPSSQSNGSAASSSPVASLTAFGGGSTKPPVGQHQSSDGCLVDEIAAIRNDRVIWIDGYEDGCSEINNLIQILCSVITNSARLSLYSNNALDKVVINKRTKAHVACYPGNGTRYIKHVDNPNGDGRLITSIYYLNKDWNAKRDGGLLRMFPVGMDQVANIEPLFDRVLFFWSDRRNPHEVLPAYKDRFAITVWYIGETRA